MLQLDKLFPNETVPKSSEFLSNVRICLFGAAWVHIVIVAVLLIPIDMSKDEDPKVRPFERVKWKLISGWFNLINIAYYPLCLYCEWRNKRKEGYFKNVTILRRIRDVILTSILIPCTMYCDIHFWRLYSRDPSLIVPISIFSYLPSWGNHSIHSVSLVVVILDLLLMPRRRPKSLIPGLGVLTSFCTIYAIVIVESWFKGEMVYNILETMSSFDKGLYLFLSYIEFVFYFTLQWFVIDYVWGTRESNTYDKYR